MRRGATSSWRIDLAQVQTLIGAPAPAPAPTAFKSSWGGRASHTIPCLQRSSLWRSESVVLCELPFGLKEIHGCLSLAITVVKFDRIISFYKFVNVLEAIKIIRSTHVVDFKNFGKFRLQRGPKNGSWTLVTTSAKPSSKKISPWDIPCFDLVSCEAALYIFHKRWKICFQIPGMSTGRQSTPAVAHSFKRTSCPLNRLQMEPCCWCLKWWAACPSFARFSAETVSQ